MWPPDSEVEMLWSFGFMGLWVSKVIVLWDSKMLHDYLIQSRTTWLLDAEFKILWDFNMRYVHVI